MKLIDKDALVAEIDRLENKLYYEPENFKDVGAKMALDSLKSFLGTLKVKELQEESVSEELEKVVEEIVDPTVLNAYGVKEIANRLRRTMIDSVSEDLGEYIDKLSKQFPEVSFAKLSRIAVRVAKWQAEQFEKDYTDLCNGIATAKGLAVTMAYEKGVADTKEQMMAKAKSGTVQKDNQVILDNGTYIDLDPSMQLKPSFVGLKEEDRIKVILINED